MKYSKARVSKMQTGGRRLSLGGFVRVAALLTLGATLVMLALVLVSGVLCAVTIAVIWTVTITIGCFVMVPVGLWRIGKQLSRGTPGKVANQGQVWDRWMDGPEPSVP